jgi:hypothetical protein
MAEHCAKHDITYQQGGECWNCEEQKMIAAGTREAAYQDPAFLHKRGGAQFQQTTLNAAIHKLSQLSPEQLANLIALANTPQPGATRRLIAVG